jgi:hypothetical protein
MLERQYDLTSRDSAELYRLAAIIKSEENDELAEEVYKRAQMIERDEDWAFDRARDNSL